MKFTSIALALVACAATTNAFSVGPSATSFVSAARTTATRAPSAPALFLQSLHSEDETSESLEHSIADESAFNAIDASKIAMQSAFAWAVTTQMASAAGPDWGT